MAQLQDMLAGTRVADAWCGIMNDALPQLGAAMPAVPPGTILPDSSRSLHIQPLVEHTCLAESEHTLHMPLEDAASLLQPAPAPAGEPATGQALGAAAYPAVAPPRVVTAPDADTDTDIPDNAKQAGRQHAADTVPTVNTQHMQPHTRWARHTADDSMRLEAPVSANSNMVHAVNELAPSAHNERLATAVTWPSSHAADIPLPCLPVSQAGSASMSQGEVAIPLWLCCPTANVTCHSCHCMACCLSVFRSTFACHTVRGVAYAALVLVRPACNLLHLLVDHVTKCVQVNVRLCTKSFVLMCWQEMRLQSGWHCSGAAGPLLSNQPWLISTFQPLHC